MQKCSVFVTFHELVFEHGFCLLSEGNGTTRALTCVLMSPFSELLLSTCLSLMALISKILCMSKHLARAIVKRIFANANVMLSSVGSRWQDLASCIQL